MPPPPQLRSWSLLSAVGVKANKLGASCVSEMRHLVPLNCIFAKTSAGAVTAPSARIKAAIPATCWGDAMDLPIMVFVASLLPIQAPKMPVRCK